MLIKALAGKRESQLKKLVLLCNVGHFNSNWGAIAFREIEDKYPGQILTCFPGWKIESVMLTVKFNLLSWWRKFRPHLNWYLR